MSKLTITPADHALMVTHLAAAKMGGNGMWSGEEAAREGQATAGFILNRLNYTVAQSPPVPYSDADAQAIHAFFHGGKK